MKKTWEIIERAIEKEFRLEYYRKFPARKLAVMDYWLSQFYELRAEILGEFAEKIEGTPPYKY